MYRGHDHWAGVRWDLGLWSGSEPLSSLAGRAFADPWRWQVWPKSLVSQCFCLRPGVHEGCQAFSIGHVDQDPPDPDPDLAPLTLTPASSTVTRTESAASDLTWRICPKASSCCYNRNMEQESSAEGVAAEARLPMSSKKIIWTIIGVVVALAMLGPLGLGLGLMIFVILRRSLTRTQRIRLSVLAGVSILYGLAFSLIPWWLSWLTSTPSMAVTHI